MAAQHGVILHPDSTRPTDYLFRISIKCVIKNADGELLVVKETGRAYWDLPGGGMDHDESLQQAIARELKEEVNLEGAFTYRILAVEEPDYLQHGFWQVRLVFAVEPTVMVFSPGTDSDDVKFMPPDILQDSDHKAERLAHHYASLT